jgi:hypothetical protein
MRFRAPFVLLVSIALGTLTLAGCEKYALDRQMNALCKKDGGVKIYETVTLAEVDFNKLGVPLPQYWLDPSLVGSSARLGPAYRYVSREESLKAGNPMNGDGQLTRFVQEVHRVVDGRLLATSVWYGRAGGDFLVLGHFSTAGCPSPQPPFLTAVFLKAGS